MGLAQCRGPSLSVLPQSSRRRVGALNVRSTIRDQSFETRKCGVRLHEQLGWWSRQQRVESREEKNRIRAVASAYPPVAKTERTFRLPIDYYQVMHLVEASYTAPRSLRAFSRFNYLWYCTFGFVVCLEVRNAQTKNRPGNRRESG